MHLLAAQPRGVDDDGDAVDLDIAPGDILFLSAADTELSALAACHKAGTGDLSLRLANLMALSHPYSIDLFVEKTLAHSKLVIIRLLGGAGYWQYGLDRAVETARGQGTKLIVVPGDGRWDAELAAHSTVDEHTARRLWSYFAEGGSANVTAAVGYCRHLLVGAPEPDPARPIAPAGLHWPGLVTPSLADIAGRWSEADRPVAAITFYRSLVQGAALAPVDALIGALDKVGINALPIYVTSLKETVSAAMVAEIFAAHPPAVVLNATAFAVSKIGARHEPTPLDAPGRPVLQVVFSGSDEAGWQESLRGLSIRDLTMNVVLPEIDGRVLTRAVSFKEEGRPDPQTGYAPITYAPRADRVDFVAELAVAWARIGRTPVADRRLALILANYPNKDGRLANGVGLDTPASVVTVIEALAEDGYDTAAAPGSSAELMALLQAGPTNALNHRAGRDSGISIDIAAYETFLADLPSEVGDQITGRWGPPRDDPHVANGAFQLALHRFGNVVVGIQPARGYNIDPKDTYHDPALVPPHHYLAFYAWLRRDFGAQAIVHMGKHGNLEWLPGKALALSETCFPDAIFGPVPHLYPFIVNDPGEGSQAKRRTGGVIIDHLTPPMTRAETYGPLAELETLIDEYYLASGIDQRRMAVLEEDIFDLVHRHGLDADLNIGVSDNKDASLAAIDAHLCDLKELQIRDGLHILGVSPANQQRTDLIVALARLPRGPAPGDQSLHRAIAADLGLGEFDPLDCDLGDAYEGPKPAELALALDAPWRTNGDTVERIELLAAALVDGRQGLDGNWLATSAVMAAIESDIAPSIDQSGSQERAAMLAGLNGRFVPPGPSGAPSRGRPDVLPTGRNFYSVDVRSVPTDAAWRLGWKSAERLMERHFQDEGEWLTAIVLTVWGTSNMRTGGDDLAQALALIGARPVWESGSGRVTGFEVIPLGELGRPRVDVTLRISGFFRDAFPYQIDLFDSAVRAIADLDEPEDANPIAARVKRESAEHRQAGLDAAAALRAATHRVFGARPGAYGAGLQTLIDEGIWEERGDFADAFLTWGGYAYGGGVEGDQARSQLETRLAKVDAVVHNQDNREHDLLDSDDYYQFEGGLAATVATLSGRDPNVYHNDHSRPERPVVRTLDEEIARVVRGRAANPKWIAGIMRHGYKGAFEMAATLDYLFAFAATTRAVKDHHFDQLFDAYIDDAAVRDFVERENPAALQEMIDRFREAIDRGLWSPRRNSTYDRLETLSRTERDEETV